MTQLPYPLLCVIVYIGLITMHSRTFLTQLFRPTVVALKNRRPAWTRARWLHQQVQDAVGEDYCVAIYVWGLSSWTQRKRLSTSIRRPIGKYPACKGRTTFCGRQDGRTCVYICITQWMGPSLTFFEFSNLCSPRQVSAYTFPRFSALFADRLFGHCFYSYRLFSSSPSAS